MQVTSNTSYTPQVNPALNVDTQVRVNQQGEQLLVREQGERTQQQRQNDQNQTRFDVDQQALALVEQEQERLSSQANNNASFATSAQYDQPSQRNQTAVAAYQSVNDQQQRDSIAQAFGVDLYA